MTEHEELFMLRALVEKQKESLAAKDKMIEGQKDKQKNLFETTQELAKELYKEQKKITVTSYTRTARQPGVRAEMLPLAGVYPSAILGKKPYYKGLSELTQGN